MRLYEELFKIDERVLYFDTDSIIFISNENHYEPELADYWGKFTNEIKGDNFIEEFVSAGPKNYGYNLIMVKQVVKLIVLVLISLLVKVLIFNLCVFLFSIVILMKQ
jgi:hypothetical protein